MSYRQNSEREIPSSVLSMRSIDSQRGEHNNELETCMRWTCFFLPFLSLSRCAKTVYLHSPPLPSSSRARSSEPSVLDPINSTSRRHLLCCRRFFLSFFIVFVRRPAILIRRVCASSAFVDNIHSTLAAVESSFEHPFRIDDAKTDDILFRPRNQSTNARNETRFYARPFSDAFVHSQSHVCVRARCAFASIELQTNWLKSKSNERRMEKEIGEEKNGSKTERKSSAKQELSHHIYTFFRCSSDQGD